MCATFRSNCSEAQNGTPLRRPKTGAAVVSKGVVKSLKEKNIAI